MKTRIISTLSAILAGLTLASCAAQTADPPLPTVESSSGASVQTSTAPVTTIAATTSITTSEEITTPEITEADQTEPVITPEMTDPTVPPTTGRPTTETETETDRPTTEPTPTETEPTTVETPTTTKPATTTKPVTTTTPATTTTKPATTTTKPATTTTKPVTTTTKPVVTTTTKPETPPPAPHTHSWSAWTVTKAATCTAAGSQRRTCTGCNEVQTQTIDATGHNWGAWVVTKAATTEAEGVETRTCSKCGSKETRRIDKLPQQSATPADTEWMAQRFLELLNEERAKVGAQQLVTSDRLHEMAQVRADELTVLFDHSRPDGRTVGTIFQDFEYGYLIDWTQYPGMEEFGKEYRPQKSSEDIGRSWFSEDGTPDDAIIEMIRSFKTSPGHWNDMMNDVYGAVGIAVTIERIDMGEGFPDIFYCYFEVLLVDRLYE